MLYIGDIFQSSGSVGDEIKMVFDCFRHSFMRRGRYGVDKEKNKVKGGSAFN